MKCIIKYVTDKFDVYYFNSLNNNKLLKSLGINEHWSFDVKDAYIFKSVAEAKKLVKSRDFYIYEKIEN